MSLISQNTIPAPIPVTEEACFNFEQLNIFSMLQRLWTQLSVFMRTYINTAIEGSPRAAASAERLLTMADDFRDVILLFYGPELADRFNSLFTSFIAKPTNVIEGFLSNDLELVNESVQDWYNDANMLASFLAELNPYWDEFEWGSLLSRYIQIKLQMITAELGQNYQREIQIYERAFDLTTTMGSYMARGLIAQQYRGI